MPSTDDWSTNADSNATTLGINIGELCDSANINNAMREMMAQLKTKLDEVDANLDGSSDPTLASIAALTVAANKFLYTTATDTFAQGTITPFARSLLDDATASAMRTTLGIPTSSAVTVTALSLTSTGGYIRLSLGGTPFTFVYKDATGEPMAARLSPIRPSTAMPHSPVFPEHGCAAVAPKPTPRITIPMFQPRGRRTAPSTALPIPRLASPSSRLAPDGYGPVRRGYFRPGDFRLWP